MQIQIKGNMHQLLIFFLTLLKDSDIYVARQWSVHYRIVTILKSFLYDYALK
jgi:hypothetical protein